MDIHEVLRRQYGVATRAQAHAAGWTDHRLARQVGSGAMRLAHPGVYVATSAQRSPEQALTVAVLAVGERAFVSHRSAGWLWGLIERPPGVVEVTAARTNSAHPAGVVVHRPRTLGGLRTVVHRGILCTDVAGTLVDLAGVVDTGVLDLAVDRALARRMVTLARLEAETSPAGRRRVGKGALRRRLQARGMVGLPHPSVLESRTLRLLRDIGVEPLAAEVAVLGGRYRLDFLLTPRLALEVDGYAYHWTPEAKAADERRRRRIRRSGVTLLVYGWTEVVHQKAAVTAEILEELGASSSVLPGMSKGLPVVALPASSARSPLSWGGVGAAPQDVPRGRPRSVRELSQAAVGPGRRSLPPGDRA